MRILKVGKRLVIVFISIFLASGCRRTEMGAMEVTVAAAPKEQLLVVAQKRIYFGHQSVGANILDGVRDLVTLGSVSAIRIIHSDNPASIVGPGLFESSVGQNGEPKSKDASFARVVQEGLGAEGGIALYKYCFVDFSAHTDAKEVFGQYRQNINAIKAKYPLLKIVHVTVPLTTMEPTGKAWFKSLIGHETARDANARRNEFNRLLKETFRNDPIFDLAELESTHPNGMRESFTSGGQTVYSLCPEYTSDGSHLNATGRRRAAQELIALLAHL